MSRNTQSRASFAHLNAGKLPGEPIRADAQASTAFGRANDNAPANESGSSMVKQDRPHPVLRPSPNLASEADRVAFESKWAQEKTEADRAQRKASFMKVRKAALKERFHSRNR